MKISAKKTEEWREVKEEGLEYGLKKYVLFKGDIPSKRVEYRDPAGKSYKNSSQALKQLNKTKSKGKETKKEKKSKKQKSDTNHCPETAGDEMSPSKRRNKAQEPPYASGNLVCRDCMIELPDANALANHNELCHKAKSKIKTMKKPLAKVKNLEFPCDDCEFIGESKTKLKKHKKKGHNPKKGRGQKTTSPATSAPRARTPPGPVFEAEKEEEEQEDLYCEECGLEDFKLRSQLEAHMRLIHQMSLPPSLKIKKGDPKINIKEDFYEDYEEKYYEEEELEEEEEEVCDDEEFYDGLDFESIDPDVVEVEDVSSSQGNENNFQNQILSYDSSDEDSDDSSLFMDEEDEPEEITLDGDDEEEDDDVIIEDSKEEEDRRIISKFESLMAEDAEVVAKIIEDPGRLEKICTSAWWAQPAKWKPSNTWEVWNAKVPQVSAHYKVKGIEISKDETFTSYDEFDRRISPELREKNPSKSYKILYTWKKAKWFSLLDPVIPENMKIVEETLEDDE